MIPLSHFILENSTLPTVQFQAISTLRDCILRDWNQVPEEDKHLLRNLLFQFVFSKSLQSYVEKQILQAITIMYKRGWLDGGVHTSVALSTALFTSLAPILEHSSIEELSLRQRRLGIFKQDLTHQNLLTFSCYKLVISISWRIFLFKIQCNWTIMGVSCHIFFAYTPSISSPMLSSLSSQWTSPDIYHRTRYATQVDTSFSVIYRFLWCCVVAKAWSTS